MHLKFAVLFAGLRKNVESSSLQLNARASIARDNHDAGL